MPKRLTPGAMIAIGVILVISALIYLAFKGTIDGSRASNLPKSLTDIYLTSASYGSDAVQEITRLHGKEFPIVSGAMGMYGSSNQATLWVAGFSDAPTAAQILLAMHDKIASADTPFTPTGEEQITGRTVYLLDGMGQKHIYFQSKSLVIWLTVNPEIAEQSIQQILKVYP